MANRTRIKNISFLKIKLPGRVADAMGKKVTRQHLNPVEKEIIATILGGQSPVKGKRFKQYSIDYANRVKGGSRKPVDLLATSKMLDSLKVMRLVEKFGISIKFRSKIATFHDSLGAGRSKIIRRLLPKSSKGETFKPNILRVIKDIAKRIAKKQV